MEGEGGHGFVFGINNKFKWMRLELQPYSAIHLVQNLNCPGFIKVRNFRGYFDETWLFLSKIKALINLGKSNTFFGNNLSKSFVIN